MKCVNCGAKFIPKRPSQRYCSKECALAVSRCSVKKVACAFCGRDARACDGHMLDGRVFCSERCKERWRKGLFHLRPQKDGKTMSDWEREARECKLDYGTYRALIGQGKTYEELKARYGENPAPVHSKVHMNHR